MTFLRFLYLACAAYYPVIISPSEFRKRRTTLSFLSKMGSVLHKVEGVVTNFSPLIGMAVGAVGALLPDGSKAKDVLAAVPGEIQQAVSLIQSTEAFGQALGTPGPDKLKAAAGPMAQIILQSTAFAGKKIKNPDLFKQGATKVADGLADCLNSVDEGEVKVQNL